MTQCSLECKPCLLKSLNYHCFFPCCQISHQCRTEVYLSLAGKLLKIEYFPHSETIRVKSSCPLSTCVLHSDAFAVKCQQGSWCATVCNLAISCWRAFRWPAGALECVSTGMCVCTSRVLCPLGNFLVCVCLSALRILSANMCPVHPVCKCESKSSQCWGKYPHAPCERRMKWLYVVWCPVKLDRWQNSSAAVIMVTITSYTKHLNVSFNGFIYLNKNKKPCSSPYDS